MIRSSAATAFAVLLFAPNVPARADDKEAIAILDKAIKALGGAEKLSDEHGFMWKSTIKISNGEVWSQEMTVHGADHSRRERVTPNGKRVLVFNGANMWEKIGVERTRSSLPPGPLAERRLVNYADVCTVLIAPLNSDKFQVQSAGEEMIGNAKVAVVKVVVPGGQSFNLYFDKVSGLPVRETHTVERGSRFLTVQADYLDYREFNGVKTATKILWTVMGDTYSQEQTVTDFKILDKVDPALFAKPE